MNNEKQYTIAQASEKFGVQLRTLRLWISKGWVECDRIGPRCTLITEEQFNARKVPQHGGSRKKAVIGGSK